MKVLLLAGLLAGALDPPPGDPQEQPSPPAPERISIGVVAAPAYEHGAEAPVGRLRVWNEVGMDGGDAIRPFVTAGVKWGF